MSTDILKGPFDLPNFSLEISSSILLEVVEKIKKLVAYSCVNNL